MPSNASPARAARCHGRCPIPFAVVSYAYMHASARVQTRRHFALFADVENSHAVALPHCGHCVPTPCVQCWARRCLGHRAHAGPAAAACTHIAMLPSHASNLRCQSERIHTCWPLGALRDQLVAARLGLILHEHAPLRRPPAEDGADVVDGPNGVRRHKLPQKLLAHAPNVQADADVTCAHAARSLKHCQAARTVAVATRSSSPPSRS